jgi:hypothetical protein
MNNGIADDPIVYAHTAYLGDHQYQPRHARSIHDHYPQAIASCVECHRMNTRGPLSQYAMTHNRAGQPYEGVTTVTNPNGTPVTVMSPDSLGDWLDHVFSE